MAFLKGGYALDLGPILSMSTSTMKRSSTRPRAEVLGGHGLGSCRPHCSETGWRRHGLMNILGFYIPLRWPLDGDSPQDPDTGDDGEGQPTESSWATCPWIRRRSTGTAVHGPAPAVPSLPTAISSPQEEAGKALRCSHILLSQNELGWLI